MTLDQRIAQALAHLKVAWANSDEHSEATWHAELDRLLDARNEFDRYRAQFDVLKGHPDHSGLSHA